MGQPPIRFTRRPGVVYSALTQPQCAGSRTGCGTEKVAVFGAASEAFSQKYINCSIAESLARFEPVLERAKAANVFVRGYASACSAAPTPRAHRATWRVRM